MTTVLLRSEKGSALTNDELDANFSNLNSDKQELSDILNSLSSVSDDGALLISGSNVLQQLYQTVSYQIQTLL